MSQLPRSSSLQAGRAEDLTLQRGVRVQWCISFQNVVRHTECMLSPEGGCCDVACIQCFPDLSHENNCAVHVRTVSMTNVQRVTYTSRHSHMRN